MLEELLRHDKLGNREEILFFLFDGLSAGNGQSLIGLQKYCTANIFSISRSFSGIVKFFQYISFIEVIEDRVSLNSQYFQQTKFIKHSYLEQFRLYEHLFNTLKRDGVLQELFNENNLKFSHSLKQYYVLGSRFPYKYFPFRNSFLSLGFFQRNEILGDNLLIKKEFTCEFKKIVVDKLISSDEKIKKISLAQLKKFQKSKEEKGKLAELFALDFEHRRLNGHPELNRVEIISEEYVNAGFDIESFDDTDSIVFDRFIEVKSYVGEISFFWSKNEIEKAKELKGRYWLYLIDRSRTDEVEYKPNLIQDPYKRIFKNDIWQKETETWKIILTQ